MARWLASLLLHLLLAGARGAVDTSSAADQGDATTTGGPLHAAAIKASLEWAKQAIEDGASMNERDALGYTPLHRVSEDGLVDACSLFLEHGADTEARDHNEATPLLLAAGGGHVDVIEMLLSHDARIDAIDEYGLGVLHYAAEGGHTAAIRVLLEQGADADYRDEAGKTAGQLARAWGFKEAAALLSANEPSIVIEEEGQENAAIDAANATTAEDAQAAEPKQMQMPTNLQPEKLEL